MERRHDDVREPGAVWGHYDGRCGEDFELLSDWVMAQELHHVVVWEVLDKGFSNLRAYACVFFVIQDTHTDDNDENGWESAWFLPHFRDNNETAVLPSQHWRDILLHREYGVAPGNTSAT